MKALNLIFVVALLAVLAGCSTTKLQYDTRPGVNFYDIKSYSWLQKDESYPTNAKDALTQGSLWDKRIQKSVNIELITIGLQLTKEEPDVLVTYYTSVEDKTLMSEYPSFRRRYRGYGADVSVAQFKEGTIIVDILDRETKEILWRGIAQTRVDEDLEPKEVEKDLAKAVKKMFSKFHSSLNT